MSQRSNEDIIRIVKKWQEAGFVHELTCRINSAHEALAPIEQDGKVMLGCPTCGTAQEVPALVLDSEAFIDFNHTLFERTIGDREVRNARQDVWFAAAVIVCGCAILPGLVAGFLYGLAGGTVGAAASYAYARRALRKIDALPEETESRP